MIRQLLSCCIGVVSEGLNGDEGVEEGYLRR